MECDAPMLDDLVLNKSFFLIGLLLIAALLLTKEVGYWIGLRSTKRKAVTEKQEKTIGTITGAMLSLLVFMLVVIILPENWTVE